MTVNISAETFREVLGQYPTGVVVASALDSSGNPIGMTVGSFTSVSLEPPLIAFCPDRGSSSWAALQDAGEQFCINILGSSQENVCRAVASRKENKFEGLDWHHSPNGLPILDGAVAWIDCERVTIHEAGDHHIVVAQVLNMQTMSSETPLLFFRSGYGSFKPLSLAAADTNVIHLLKSVDVARPHMESLATKMQTEVVAFSMLGDELVASASAGRTVLTRAQSRVGHRVPFVPPIGSAFAAFGPQSVRERWFANLGSTATPQIVQTYVEMLERVSANGYSIRLNHRLSARFEEFYIDGGDGNAETADSEMRSAIESLTPLVNPADADSPILREVRLLSAPVFDQVGEVPFILTMWGPPEPLNSDEIRVKAAALMECASRVTRSLGGQPVFVESLADLSLEAEVHALWVNPHSRGLSK